MNDFMKKILGINWKTTFTGLVTWLMAVPSFYTAMMALYNHQAVDWRQVGIGVALAAGGSGLVAAKDGTTHSTAAEVKVSTIENPAVQAKAAAEPAVPPKP